MNLITVAGMVLIVLAIGVYVWSRPLPTPTDKHIEPWLVFTKGGAITVAVLMVFALVLQSWSSYEQGYKAGYDRGHDLGERQANRLAQCAEDDYWYPINFQKVNKAEDLVCKNVDDLDELIDRQTANAVIITLVATGILTPDEGTEYLNSLKVMP